MSRSTLVLLSLLPLAMGCSDEGPRSHASSSPVAPSVGSGYESVEADVDDSMNTPELNLGSSNVDERQVVAGPAVPNQVVVKLAPGASLSAFNAEWGTSTICVVEGTSSALVHVPLGSDLIGMILDMELDEDCDDVEPNYLTETPEGTRGTIPFYEANHIFSDVFDQDALLRIGATDLHDTVTGAGVVVAILDTGIDATHPDLAAFVSAGRDFIDEDLDPSDTRDYLDNDGDGYVDEGAGHGTHVAGLVHAVAPGATLMPVRVLDSEGMGTGISVARGIRYAVANGADIINLSLGMYVTSRVIKRAIEDAADADVIVVNAAGNRGILTEEHFPSRMSHVISVAATDPMDTRASFSNFGSHIEISAPGEGILSTFLDHGYAIWSGTSMATPLVSGTIALRLEFDPTTTESDISDGFEDNSAPLVGEDGAIWEDKMGAGRISAAIAVDPDLD